MSTVVRQGLLDELAFFSGLSCAASIHEPIEPKSYRVASEQKEWQEAMIEEVEALQSQGTWVLVPKPVDKNIVGCKWVYKLKKNADGTISRCKARLVAQGFSQTEGLDYTETFSPIVRHSTVRIILALTASSGWKLRQFDVKNTFLHGDLQEDIFMRQPQGFESLEHPDFVCKLRKFLYGLKQAPRAQNEKFTGHLPALGFKASHSDPSLFVKESVDVIVVLLL
ncbi:hypothetical protein ACLB2K_034479 [Fragaria x ananassa]